MTMISVFMKLSAPPLYSHCYTTSSEADWPEVIPALSSAIAGLVQQQVYEHISVYDLL